MRIVSIDIALVGVSWVLLYGIQYLIDPGLANKEVLWSGLSIVPLMIVMSLYVGGCYAHPVRSFSMSDALRLVIVLSIGWLVSFLVMLDVMGGRGIEIYLSPVGWLIMLPLTLLPRVSRRLMWERVLGESFHSNEHHVLLYGAGYFGELFSRWLKVYTADASVLGFLDDADVLAGRRINGLRVLGRGIDLPVVHERYQVDEIWVTFHPNESTRKHLTDLVEQLGVRVVFILDQDPFCHFSKRQAHGSARASRVHQHNNAAA